MRILIVLTAIAACSSERAAPRPSLRLVHTFNPDEAAALEDFLADRRQPVATAILPFARGQMVLHEVLASGVDCPDVARIDATWLPLLVEDGLLLPAPDALATSRSWLPEAGSLAEYHGARWALPHSLDGLAVVYRPQAVAEPAGVTWPATTLDELEASARALTRPGRWGLGVRVDGYWLVAWLRAAGADVADGTTGDLGIDGPEAVAAVERYAALLRDGGVSPPPPPPGDEAGTEARWFRDGQLAALVTGPWALPELAGPGLEGVAVAPLPGAPRGGQLLVVPRCARDPDGGWRLAAELTDPRLTGAWSRRTGMIPATVDGLAAGAEVSRAFAGALSGARPLPRHPVSAWLFDDLNPALAAVVAGDATAEEAVAGVRRAWTRALERARAPGGGP